MPDEILSFQFKQGVFTLYRYDKDGNMEVLYDDKWMDLASFIKDFYATLTDYQTAKNIKRA